MVEDGRGVITRGKDGGNDVAMVGQAVDEI